MRARPNAPSNRMDSYASIDNVVGTSNPGEADVNGKDKPKFKRPPTTSFKLPPPPKIYTSPAFRSVTGREASSKVIADAPTAEIKAGENVVVIEDPETFVSPPVPAVPIPPPPSTTSAVYQRIKRNPQQSDSNSAAANPLIPPGYEDVTAAARKRNSRDSYSNAYPAPQYPPSSNYSQKNHPYQPSAWYLNNRNTQRNRQLVKKVVGAVFAITAVMLILWALQYLKSIEHVQRHHQNFHHHDHRRDIHPMMGIVESPLGFTNEMTREEKSYRQSKQGHTSLEHHQTEGENSHALFSIFPVTTLSNGRLLPYVGFGVSSHSVEHKQIPIIVSTLLQYASSETLGGGGIAMIDAVIHDESKLELDDGNLQDSEEEKIESAMEKTVVALVGRSINFFGKEHIKSAQGFLPGMLSDSTDNLAPYDYENRLEVHVLVGLSGNDLGAENSIAALRDFVAELDGIVPPFPTDVFNTDLSEWNIKPPPNAVDHHVDVRLHLLVRLSQCHDEHHNIAPCSFDKKTNKDLLESFLGSYALLERLYSGNIIHGIGLEGVGADDIQYLLDNCKIKPQLYRGNVMQALDIYGRRHGRQHIQDEEHIARVLKENNITFLASNAAGTILERKLVSPNAYALLQNLGGVLYRAHLESAQSGGKVTSSHKGEGQYYTVPKLVLSYLVRHKVCVLPHVYKAEHLADDAPESVSGLANFLSERRMAEIGAAVRALLSEIDLPENHRLGMEGEKEVAGVFHNVMLDEVHISQVRDNYSTTKWEIPGENDGYPVWTVGHSDSVVIIAKAGDVFRAFGPNGAHRGTYVMSEEEGGCTDFTIVPPLDYN